MQTIKIPATDENLQTVNEFVHAQLPADCPFKVLNEIDLAIEEIYINIAHYAYAPGSGDVEIDCAVSGEPPRLFVEFRDNGVQFDPIAKKDPDITLSAEERPIGGLGVFLTKKFMDSVEYRYSGGQNILTIVKTVTG